MNASGLRVGFVKGVMVDNHPVSCIVCSVYAITPSVHVYRVKSEILPENVVTGFVRCTSPASACDPVPVIIEVICLDQRINCVEDDSVAVADVIIVVDIIVVNLEPEAIVESVNSSVGPTVDLTIIDLAVAMNDLNSSR
jgi:hypothetical protein